MMISPEVLRRFPFFAHFSDASLKLIAMAGEMQRFQAEEWILLEGNQASDLCLLLSGEIHVAFRMGNGDLAVSDTITPGEAFSWSALLAPFILTSSCIGSKSGEYIAIHAGVLEDLRTQDPEGTLYLMMEIAKTMRDRMNALRVQIVANTPKLVLSET
ncbi:MAG: cyclic nucleotide-binding domain-containing protein [Anaerolineales bacterium]|nr:cyclic nucleotide-binding domain-containing protein [Anaerolineales bacterium]